MERRWIIIPSSGNNPLLYKDGAISELFRAREHKIWRYSQRYLSSTKLYFNSDTPHSHMFDPSHNRARTLIIIQILLMIVKQLSDSSHSDDHIRMFEEPNTPELHHS